jgi:hypothetical protein
MKRFLPILAAVVLAGCSLLHSPPASAATVTATWTNPTTNTDNSAIPDTGAESLQSVRIEYGTCVSGAFGVKAGEFVRTRVAGQPMLTTATNNVPTGLTCFRAFVTNASGAESAPSNLTTTTVNPSTPRSPTNLQTSSG